MSNDLTPPTSSTSNLATWSPDGNPVPIRVMERLFARLTAIYGGQAMHADGNPALKLAVWARALADISLEEMQLGMEALPTFPPNLQQLLLAFRPSLNDEAAWYEAHAGVRSFHTFRWSHPSVRAAAQELAAELQRSEPYAWHKVRWAQAMREARARYRATPVRRAPVSEGTLSLPADDEGGSA